MKGENRMEDRQKLYDQIEESIGILATASNALELVHLNIAESGNISAADCLCIIISCLDRLVTTQNAMLDELIKTDKEDAGLN